MYLYEPFLLFECGEFSPAVSTFQKHPVYEMVYEETQRYISCITESLLVNELHGL